MKPKRTRAAAGKAADETATLPQEKNSLIEDRNPLFFW